MIHTCHAPNCTIPVPPELFACKQHWNQIPRMLRAKIWAAYRPGQEITKKPSPAWMEAARQAKEFWNQTPVV